MNHKLPSREEEEGAERAAAAVGVLMAILWLEMTRFASVLPRMSITLITFSAALHHHRFYLLIDSNLNLTMVISCVHSIPNPSDNEFQSNQVWAFSCLM